QLIISGAQLAEMDDFLLLRRTKAFHTYVPLVVTASASEKDSARRLLTKGAFDLITTPLEHEQTVGTIRLALWQSKLMGLIAHKEETLEKYRQHMTDYPGDRRWPNHFSEPWRPSKKRFPRLNGPCCGWKKVWSASPTSRRKWSTTPENERWNA